MPIRISETLKKLLITYVVAFVVQHAIDQFFGGNLKGWFALIPSEVLHGKIWQLFTYSFLHADVMHLVLNVIVLAFVGSDVESVWGRNKMLRYYFICISGAGLLYLLAQLLIGNPMYLGLPMVGASGGIYGLLLAYGVLFPEREMLFMMIFPLKARQFIWVLAGMEFLQALFSGQGGLGALAHLSGMGVGYALMWFESNNIRLSKVGSNKPKKKNASHLRLVKGESPEPDDSKGPKTWH